MQILVNGKPHRWDKPLTIAALLAERGLAERRGLAVAVNAQVLPKRRWRLELIKADDEVEIVNAVPGG